jgi:endonuclease YncB( thermonuclease family)
LVFSGWLALPPKGHAEGVAQTEEKVRVFRVFSGDSVLVRQRGRSWRARLDGVEAPDPSTAAGEASRAILEKMIGGRHVFVVVVGEEPDAYSRVRMRLEDWDIAREMAGAGAVRVRSADPRLLAAEAEARANGYGLWGMENR